MEATGRLSGAKKMTRLDRAQRLAACDKLDFRESRPVPSGGGGLLEANLRPPLDPVERGRASMAPFKLRRRPIVRLEVQILK